MIERMGKIYIPTCDGCGAELPEEWAFMGAVVAMKAAGWRQVPPRGAVEDWYHLCPVCAAKSDFEQRGGEC